MATWALTGAGVFLVNDLAVVDFDQHTPACMKAGQQGSTGCLPWVILRRAVCLLMTPCQCLFFEVPQHQPGELAAFTLVCFKGMVPGSILGVSSSFLCTFLRYRLPLVHPDSL